MAKNSSTSNPFYKKWQFWVILIILIGIAGAGGGAMNNKNNNGTQNNSESSTQAKNDNNNYYSVDEDFSFNGLKLNISGTYSFTTLNNEFSEHNGKTVVVLPISVTNQSKENTKLNMYSYKIFGAQGVELDKIAAYFSDDAIDFAGELQPGASYTKNFYFLYDGDADYTIQFGFFGAEAIVKVPISRN